MTQPPSPEDTALWQRRMASQANNRAWSLAETPQRTAQEDEEMLQAAHAAMYFWKQVGNDHHRALAALLVAHVCALLGDGPSAARFWAQAQPAFFGGQAQDWEVAMAHAVQANVAYANQELLTHLHHYVQAHVKVAQLPDPEDRKILESTLRVLPKPQAAHGGSHGGST